MAAPNPASIVSDPAPLTNPDFPYAVLPFPASDLVNSAQIIPQMILTTPAPLADNPNRFALTS
jgi:hypothetical protein